MKAQGLVLTISCHFWVVKLVLIIIYITRAETTNCSDKSIGVEAKGIIPDSSFTATSHYDYRYYPYYARLLSSHHGWGPKTDNTPGEYLQIDLGFEYFICAVATQGRSSTSEYAKTYKLKISVDNVNWTTYRENGSEKIFSSGIKNAHNVSKRFLTNQPLVRYIRFIPITYYRAKTIKVGIYGYAKFEVCITNPLGMQSQAIPDNRISASSSQQPAIAARLQSASSWCASSSDSNPYLQIGLGSDHVVCAVATQGNNAADQWVSSYRISTSSDGMLWTTYTENNITRTFYGNYDRSTMVRHVLYRGPITRYIRIEPIKTYQGIPCLRTEIYGYQLQPTCSSHSVGVPSPIIVPNHRFTASSYYSNNYKPSGGRLSDYGSWLPRTSSQHEYLQIDLGDVFLICAVLTQGNGYSYNNWVTNYKILFSDDNKSWTTYSEKLGVEKVFTGNKDKSTVVTNAIRYPFKAKFVRVLPTAHKNWKTLRVDFKGTPQACTSSLGLENSEIHNNQMTSSSSSNNSHDASRGRLYGSSSWCSSTASNTEYIQVDLGQVKTVTGIATQGDATQDKWVTSYKVSYGFSDGVWYEYKVGQVTKIFTGNSNKNDVRVNWLSRPISARYVRIHPRASKGGHCLRFDLYGCEFVIAPKASISSPNVTLPSTKGSSTTLTCTVTGEPSPDIQWFSNGTKIDGATHTTLQVQFVSAEDVMSKYSCTRQDPNTRPVVCKTRYTCRVVYPMNVSSAAATIEVSAQVTTNLNVPAAPSVLTFTNKTSIQLYWNPASMVSDDVGMITWYNIEFINESIVTKFSVPHPTATFDLTFLKPSTDYSVRMRAVSNVGRGLWSTWINITVNTTSSIIKDRNNISDSSSNSSVLHLALYITVGVVIGLAVLLLSGCLLYKLKRKIQLSQISDQYNCDVIPTPPSLLTNDPTIRKPAVHTGQGSATYMELQPSSRIPIYQPLLRTENNSCNSNEMKDVPAEYLEVLPNVTPNTGNDLTQESEYEEILH